MTKIRLDSDTINWIHDRIANREALMWNEFILFMIRLEKTKKKIQKYKSKRYRNLVKERYIKKCQKS